jgi:hypothetical protein
MSKCSYCGKIAHTLDTVRCNDESCNEILCVECKDSHSQCIFPEPLARSCFDPECNGCWGCSDLSIEEYSNG